MGLIDGIINRVIWVLARTPYEPEKIKKRKSRVTISERVLNTACNALRWGLKKLRL